MAGRKLFRKLLLALLLVLIASYLGFGIFLWWAMRQPPEQFGRVMMKIQGPVPFLLYPFETMWVHARAGGLKVGDAAPDFSLMKVDKSGALRLSELNKQQPVVIVFGSYT
jgi:hypothetical protein